MCMYHYITATRRYVILSLVVVVELHCIYAVSEYDLYRIMSRFVSYLSAQHTELCYVNETEAANYCKKCIKNLKKIIFFNF